jgi:hypothetical protein
VRKTSGKGQESEGSYLRAYRGEDGEARTLAGKSNILYRRLFLREICLWEKKNAKIGLEASAHGRRRKSKSRAREYVTPEQKSPVDAVAYVINRTHNAWNKGHIAGLLLMDVKGAFDHVNHRRLLTTMVAKTLDGDLIEWTEHFVTNRTVQITVDGYDGEVSPVHTGIPQGSPVSSILFAIYISCLSSHIENTVEGVEGISFADDEGWWVSAKEIGEITNRMEKCAL